MPQGQTDRAAIHIPAPVVRPCTDPRLVMIDPAARKATPAVCRLDQAQRIDPQLGPLGRQEPGQLWRQKRRQAGGKRDQHVGPEPGGLGTGRAVEPDQAAQKGRGHQPRQQRSGGHRPHGAAKIRQQLAEERVCEFGAGHPPNLP